MTAGAPSIVGKITALHAALDHAELPHAFGGALALAWCTERARGTIDIDVNVFVGAARSAEVFAALPRGFFTAAIIDLLLPYCILWPNAAL